MSPASRVATLALLAVAVSSASVKKVSSTTATTLPEKGGSVNLESKDGSVTASLTFTSAHGLVLKASKCVDRSNWCGRYQRTDCAASSEPVIAAIVLSDSDRVVLHQDGTLAFQTAGCINPVSTFDGPPEHGVQLVGKDSSGYLSVDGGNISLMSKSGFEVNEGSIEPVCSCANGIEHTDQCTAHLDTHCKSCHAGYGWSQDGKDCVVTYSWSKTAASCPTDCGHAESTPADSYDCVGSNGSTGNAASKCGTKPSTTTSCAATASCYTFAYTMTAATCPTACGTAASTPANTYTCIRTTVASGSTTTVDDASCGTKPSSTTSCSATSACVTYSWSKTAASCPTACGTAESTPADSYDCVGSDGSTSNIASKCGTMPSTTTSCAATSPCPVDGGWGSWTNGPCSVTACGKTGKLTRSRTCNNPEPEHGGVGCTGSTKMFGNYPIIMGTESVQDTCSTPACPTPPSCYSGSGARNGRANCLGLNQGGGGINDSCHACDYSKNFECIAYASDACTQAAAKGEKSCVGGWQTSQIDRWNQFGCQFYDEWKGMLNQHHPYMKNCLDNKGKQCAGKRNSHCFGNTGVCCLGCNTYSCSDGRTAYQCEKQQTQEKKCLQCSN